MLLKLPNGVNGSFDWRFLDEEIPESARVIMRYHTFRTSSGKVSWMGQHVSHENDETEWWQLVTDLRDYKHYFDVEALHQFDWFHLKTPFGNNPSPFPYLLCALTFSDPIIRREAIHTLNTIEYNGYISTVTYPTVMFLLALIRHSALPDRAALLNVLLSVVRAEYYDPGNIPLDHFDDEQPSFGQYQQAYQAYFAIGNAIPFFLTLLAHPDTDIRRLSSSILGCYQKRSQQIWPVLEQAFKTEPNELLQALHLFNLCNLVPANLEGDILWLDAIRSTHQSELVRCYATIRLASFCQHLTPPDAVASLIEWFTTKPEELSQQYGAIPDDDYFGPNHFLGDIERALQGCGRTTN